MIGKRKDLFLDPPAPLQVRPGTKPSSSQQQKIDNCRREPSRSVLSQAAKEAARDGSFGRPSQMRSDLLIAQWSINLRLLSCLKGSSKPPAGLPDYRH